MDEAVVRPRLILYVGKGGTGKTTLAAATAVRAAELGHRALVVSTDIAHSLGDVLDTTLGSMPMVVRERLFAQEINVLEETRREWSRLHASLDLVLTREGFSPLQADELAVVPGMEEVAALLQIRRHVQRGEHDCIVIDAAPTGETIRLLSMPSSFLWYAGRLEAWKTRLMRVAGPLVRRMVPEIDLAEIMRTIKERVNELREYLVDPRRTTYRLVVTPDRTVLKEARRAETYLNLFQYPIDAVVLNRVIPPSEPSNPYLERLRARQAAVIDDVRRSFSPLPILEAPNDAAEPVGLEDLSRFGSQLFGEHDPTEVLHVGPTLRIDPTERGFVLRIPMPNVEVGKLSLRKVGDELYVDIGNVRREVSLPAALAELEPCTARIRDGTLEIPFSA